MEEMDLNVEDDINELRGKEDWCECVYEICL